MIISTLALWLGVFVLTAYTIEVIAQYLGEGKNVLNKIYMSIIIGEIIISKVISYISVKKFGYDFWGKLNSKKYQQYLCDNCLKHINEDYNEEIFIKAVKRYGWKNISFTEENYSFIQIQYLLYLLLDNIYDDKCMKEIVEEYILPIMENYKNKKDIINLILQHTHLSIKKMNREDNIEVYLILYSKCIRLQLEDTLSITECNLCNFVNSFERRKKLEALTVLPQYIICKPVLPKVNSNMLANKKQEIRSYSKENIPTIEEFING